MVDLELSCQMSDLVGGPTTTMVKGSHESADRGRDEIQTRTNDAIFKLKRWGEIYR